MGFYSILQRSATGKTGIRREDHFLGTHIGGSSGLGRGPRISSLLPHPGIMARIAVSLDFSEKGA